MIKKKSMLFMNIRLKIVPKAYGPVISWVVLFMRILLFE